MVNISLQSLLFLNENDLSIQSADQVSSLCRVFFSLFQIFFYWWVIVAVVVFVSFTIKTIIKNITIVLRYNNNYYINYYYKYNNNFYIDYYINYRN